MMFFVGLVESPAIGEWVDVEDLIDFDEDTLLTEIHRIVGEDKEWIISDYDELPNCGEHPDLDFLGEVARLTLKYEDAFVAYCRWADEVDWDENEFQKSYQGVFSSVEDFIWEDLDCNGTLHTLDKAGFSRSWVDIDQIKRDWFDYGDYTGVEVGNQVYIFCRY